MVRSRARNGQSTSVKMRQGDATNRAYGTFAKRVPRHQHSAHSHHGPALIDSENFHALVRPYAPVYHMSVR